MTTVVRRLERLEALPWARVADTRLDRFTRYRDDPLGFMAQVLGVKPWQKQAEILEALAREPRVSVRSCHGAGKSTAAAWATLWFLQTRPGAIVVTTAPTGRQVRNLLWRRIRTAFLGAREPLIGRCLTTMIDCASDWYATGFATDDATGFQGPHSEHGVLFVADEASGLPEWAFEAAAGFTTQEGAKTLLIGNPNYPLGAFYESQRRWERGQRFHISAHDVPAHILRPAWIEEQRAAWGEESAAYQVRVLGEFPSEGPDSLISMAAATAAVARTLPAVGETVIGVDLARFGDAESVALVRQGPAIVAGEYWRGADLMASAGRIAAMAAEVKPRRINIDSIGIGAGVVDRLVEQGLPVTGVNVGEAATDPERYVNRRAELFFGLKERFASGDIDIPREDVEMVAQLTSLRFSYTSRGQYKLESKEDMRRRGLKSPDRADALALCFAGPTAPDLTAWAGLLGGRAARGWTPR